MTLGWRPISRTRCSLCLHLFVAALAFELHLCWDAHIVAVAETSCLHAIACTLLRRAYYLVITQQQPCLLFVSCSVLARRAEMQYGSRTAAAHARTSR